MSETQALALDRLYQGDCLERFRHVESGSIDLVSADPQGGPAATVAREAVVLALPPPPDDAAADGLPGRVVVLGVRDTDVTAVSSATVTHFLTIAWSR